ncbi:hypothetical protein ON010_g10439 [Phytophthora cinnamomi]|nr:hypothetical protein ON010_g10439 [Phytophthora cinnamomi]
MERIGVSVSVLVQRRRRRPHGRGQRGGAGAGPRAAAARLLPGQRPHGEEDQVQARAALRRAAAQDVEPAQLQKYDQSARAGSGDLGEQQEEVPRGDAERERGAPGVAAERVAQGEVEGLGGSHKPGSSIIHKCFQGFVEVTTNDETKAASADMAERESAVSTTVSPFLYDDGARFAINTAVQGFSGWKYHSSGKVTNPAFHSAREIQRQSHNARPSRLPSSEEDVPDRLAANISDLPREALYAKQFLHRKESDDCKLPGEEPGVA